MALVTIPSRRHRRIAALSIAAAIAGCTTNPTVELYNHAASTIQVSALDRRYEIASGKSQTFPWPMRKADAGVVRVCLNHLLLRYALPSIQEGYARPGIFGGQIRVQVEEDGKLRILKPDEEFPLERDGVQPDPYPMTPDREGTC